ncbi:hypothetical protein H0E87_010684 [Populus deltoides]|uniref:HXXXD-type acyl-transferase family protein n=1 Tax=Populus deltoides TaxID=3696 RepID=A0A8T2YU09_POPDE|nr:hypothetical protein H0E87_010684 [Populus deltoides]
MVPTILKTSVSGIKLSSVVPAEVTGDNEDRKLTNMDLAFKLHYVRGVSFFSNETVQGLTIYDLKEPMFSLLALYPTASGRIRKSESGRPFIKCNDGGVRIIEAHCDKTIEEWLKMNDHKPLDDYLVYDQVLGPDLEFSPLVFIQFTWFKCGGMSVGLSWAHVLGDPFSASTFINTWGKMMQGHVPSRSPHVPNTKKSKYPLSTTRRKPFSLKRVDPVGDYWLTTTNCKMETHSLHVTAEQLDDILSDNIRGQKQPTELSHFQVLSAIIWKSLSKVREDSGPRIVTICTGNSRVNDPEVPSNNLVFSIIQADFSVAEGEIYELAELIAEKQEEENSLIEDIVESDKVEFDRIAYGTNLTFVDLEEANIYGLELKGQKPIFANYSIKGVGESGVVLVLPAGPGNGSGKVRSGRTVTVTLPENQLSRLMNELKSHWGLA